MNHYDILKALGMLTFAYIKALLTFQWKIKLLNMVYICHMSM
jgi:hypothetical protein